MSWRLSVEDYAPIQPNRLVSSRRQTGLIAVVPNFEGSDRVSLQSETNRGGCLAGSLSGAVFAVSPRFNASASIGAQGLAKEPETLPIDQQIQLATILNRRKIEKDPWQAKNIERLAGELGFTLDQACQIAGLLEVAERHGQKSTEVLDRAIASFVTVEPNGQQHVNFNGQSWNLARG